MDKLDKFEQLAFDAIYSAAVLRSETSGGAAVPDGLPEERSAGPGRSGDAVEIHDAGGRDGEGQSGVPVGRPGGARGGDVYGSRDTV